MDPEKIDLSQLPLKDDSIILWRTEVPVVSGIDAMAEHLRASGFRNLVLIILTVAEASGRIGSYPQEVLPQVHLAFRLLPERGQPMAGQASL